jgi:hypothetical protein
LAGAVGSGLSSQRAHDINLPTKGKPMSKKNSTRKARVRKDARRKLTPEQFTRDLITFWNSTDAPDWFVDALVDAISDMAAHFDLPTPFVETDPEKQIALLTPLIERAGPMFDLRGLRAARFVRYEPEIEANRAYYQQQAESLIQLLSLESEHVRPLLDVEPEGILDDEPPPHLLWKAIQDHISALFDGILRNYDDDFLRTLYVELRLYYDKQCVKAKQAEENKD